MASTLTPPAVSQETATATPTLPKPRTQRPRLCLFTSRTNGAGRKVEGFVAYVLQRRQNHDTFNFHIVYREERPEVFERLGVTEVPTLMVIDGKKVCRKLEGAIRPHHIEDALAAWLH